MPIARCSGYVFVDPGLVNPTPAKTHWMPAASQLPTGNALANPAQVPGFFNLACLLMPCLGLPSVTCQGFGDHATCRTFPTEGTQHQPPKSASFAGQAPVCRPPACPNTLKMLPAQNSARSGEKRGIGCPVLDFLRVRRPVTWDFRGSGPWEGFRDLEDALAPVLKVSRSPG